MSVAMLPRILKFLGLAMAALAVVAFGFAAFWAFTLTRDLPSVDALRDYQPPITTRVYAGNGTVLGEYARERRFFVPAEFIPKLVKQAFTSAEDRNFYNHPGVDPSGILRAILTLIEQERPLQSFACGMLALVATGCALGLPVISEFLHTGLVPRLPTAVLATGLVLLGFMSLGCGLVLDVVSRGRKEMKRLAYLAVPPVRGAP
jgi:hypothetical protein